MSDQINSQPNQPPQEPLDYQNALEVMEEARLSALGQMTVEAAEVITYNTCVLLPILAVAEGETIAKQAAAERVLSQEAEEYLAGGIGAEAEEYLTRPNKPSERSQRIREVAQEYGLPAAIRLAREKPSFLELRKEYNAKGDSNLD